MDKGGGTRSRKYRSGSCSSRADADVVTYDAYVDQVDIEEEDYINNSDGAIIESDYNDDAGIFSITNDYSSEDDDTLAAEQEEIKDCFCNSHKANWTKQGRFSKRITVEQGSSGPLRAGFHRSCGGPAETERKQEWKSKCPFFY